MKSNLKKLGAVAAAIVLSTGAMAATETGTLTVNASVSGACAVGDATMSFAVAPAVNADGTGTQSSANVDTSTTVAVICTNGQSGAVSAGNGSNYDATNTTRRLSDGQATPTYVAYGLYTDSGRTTAFNATNTIAVTGTGSSESKTIYGRIAAADATAAPKGSYSDSVTLTITYTP